MKMGAGIFWGVILILIGLSIVIRIVFGINFPVFKILFALLFIFIGLRIMFGGFGLFHCNVGKDDTVFNERHYETATGDKEYNVVFGKAVYDFRDVDLSEGSVKSKINTVFGHTIIKVNRETPLRIVTDAVFAGVQLPDGNNAVFGTTNYVNPTFSEDSSYLELRVSVVFGGVEVKSY